MPIAYTVIATLPDAETREEYVSWLTGGHLAGVLGGGAISAEAVVIEDPAEPIQVESRYVFPTPDAFRSYVEDHAPSLRADGAARFGARVTFARRVGTLLSGPTPDG